MPQQPVAAARSTRNAQAPNARQPNLPALHASILARLAAACDAAALRLQAAASGQSVFASDADLKATLALLKLVPDLLPLIAPPPPPPPPESRASVEPPIYPPVYVPPRGSPLIPKCEYCGAGPGAHWTEFCPQNPNRKPYQSVD